MHLPIKKAIMICSAIMILMITSKTGAQVLMMKNPSGSTSASAKTDSPGNFTLPFTESWNQGNFSNQNWTFSSPDNNWSIDSLHGNPAPCPDFASMPYRVNYSQTLTSDTIDATPWTCASVFLDFDLKVIAYNATGNEKMDIQVFYNGSWKTTFQITNSSTSTNNTWQSHHLTIDSARGQLFQFRFVVHGINSADVLHWYLDNVHVYASCKAPKHLTWHQTGYKTDLFWNAAPGCAAISGTQTDFIFDDGTWENGWTVFPGQLGCFGNEFPIPPSNSGYILKVRLLFVDNGTGSVQPVSVDIYNSAHILVGSSATFYATVVNNAWIEVPIPNVFFSGLFYAMVKFNTLPIQTYYLASDENGPYAPQDLGWNISSTGVWAKASTLGANPAVFLCRATVMLTGYDKPVEIVPGMTGMPFAPASSDSSIIQGYNVYRSENYGVLPFTKINTVPLATLSYSDAHPHNLPRNSYWRYYVTRLYTNSADSTVVCEPSTDTVLSLYLGVHEQNPAQIIIYPNPADNQVNVKSDYAITAIEIFNFLGREVYINRKLSDTAARIDVSDFGAGVYLVKVSTGEGVYSEKITVYQ